MTRPCALMMLMVVALAAAPTPAQPALNPAPVDLGDNAALIYWQAIALMPTLTEAEDAAVQNWRSAEADPVRADLVKRIEPVIRLLRADLVKRIEPVIRLLREGAAKEHSHWGIDMSQGPHTLLPHLQKLRSLAFLALTAASEKMHQNQPQEAAEIAVAVMRMGRHIAPAGTLIEMLVQVAIQETAVAWIARHAPRMTPDVRGYVLAEIERLPPAATTASSMQGEVLFLDWARRQFEAGRVEAVRDLLAGEDVRIKGLEAADVKTLLKWLGEAEGWYGQAVAAAQQPYPQVREQMARVIKDVESSENLLAKVFFPSIGRVWVTDHRARAHLAMLRAGLQKLNGAEQMMRDPYGEGLFKMIDHAAGFTLQSRLQMDDKPVELIFGNLPPSR